MSTSDASTAGLDNRHRFIKVYFQQGLHNHEIRSVLKERHGITISLEEKALHKHCTLLSFRFSESEKFYPQLGPETSYSISGIASRFLRQVEAICTTCMH